MKRHLKVVAALIKKQGKVLICQRKENDTLGNLWEFPRGKVEDNETLKEAIIREIKEELNIEIKVKKLVDKFIEETKNFKITVYLFESSIKRGEIKPLECKDFKMVSIDNLSNYQLAPVDEKIADYLKREKSKLRKSSFSHHLFFNMVSYIFPFYDVLNILSNISR
ncbi:MAG: (deoxy)nucleoside triphosphate pyrophosphohydrolase, partial [Candidatus Omnitrophica bacterium]|nr:(deoxy)nucleoside triphosphate pyrophosphohydrolase [Candidatus Omnitrophota bacterium]